MTTGTNHWKLGLFVVVGIVGILGGLFWIGSHRLNRATLPAVTYFDESVQGLEVGSPVKFRGVRLGTVAGITVAPDHRLVEVHADMYVDTLKKLGFGEDASSDAFIPENLRFQLASAGITGVQFVQADILDPERYPAPELSFKPPPNYIPSAPSTLKSLEARVMDVLDRLPELSDHATVFMDEGRETLASIRRLSATLQEDDQPFRKLLVRLESAAEKVETAATEAKLGPTTESLRSASASVSQAADSVSAAREELLASLVALRQALESARTFTDALDRDPSSLLLGHRVDGDGPPRR